MQGGYGVVVTINVATVPTTVANLLDVDYPKFKKFIAEMTGHDSGGWYESVATGKRRLEAFSMSLGWDVGEATHQAIVAGFNSDEPVNFSIADPDGDETISFEAHIEEIMRISKQEDGMKGDIMVHPTGIPVIT